MRGNTRTVLLLVSLGMLAAVSISLMARYALPRIAVHRETALRQAILMVLPNADHYKVVDSARQVYVGQTESGNIAGYAFVGEGGGYQGAIRIMIGVSADWETLLGVIVLSNVETPGLGSKISDTAFLTQFHEKPLQTPLEYVLNRQADRPEQIQAITGATISTRAFVRILNTYIKDTSANYGEDAE